MIVDKTRNHYFSRQKDYNVFKQHVEEHQIVLVSIISIFRVDLDTHSSVSQKSKLSNMVKHTVSLRIVLMKVDDQKLYLRKSFLATDCQKVR